MSSLDLFIFCHNSYRYPFLDACVLSIETNIKDKISSFNIITDKKIKYRNFDIIEDRELWDQIDSNFKHQFLYNNNWIRQQILKLSCDKLKNNNMLIVDCDVFFIKSINLLKKNKFNFYMADEYHRPYFDTTKSILNLNKQVKKSFISDFIVFNYDILKSLKLDIETYSENKWLTTIENYIKSKSNNIQILSEYELYGSYVYKNYKHLINELIEPIDYKMWLYYELNENNQTPKNFLSYVKSKSKNYYQSVKLLSS